MGRLSIHRKHQFCESQQRIEIGSGIGFFGGGSSTRKGESTACNVRASARIGTPLTGHQKRRGRSNHGANRGVHFFVPF